MLLKFPTSFLCVGFVSAMGSYSVSVHREPEYLAGLQEFFLHRRIDAVWPSDMRALCMVISVVVVLLGGGPKATNPPANLNTKQQWYQERCLVQLLLSNTARLIREAAEDDTGKRTRGMFREELLLLK